MLVELELPHIYHTVARNSPKRPLMTEKWGNFQVGHPACSSLCCFMMLHTMDLPDCLLFWDTCALLLRPSEMHACSLLLLHSVHLFTASTMSLAGALH